MADDDFRNNELNEVVPQEAWQHIEIDFTHSFAHRLKKGSILEKTRHPNLVNNNNDYFGRAEYKIRDVQNLFVKSDREGNTAIIQIPCEDDVFNFNSHARNLDNNEIAYMFYKDNGQIMCQLYVSDIDKLPKIVKDSGTYHSLFLENKYTIQPDSSVFNIFADDDTGDSSFKMKIRLAFHRLFGFLPLCYLRMIGVHCCIRNNFQNREGRQEIDIIVPNGWVIKRDKKENGGRYFVKTKYGGTFSDNVMVKESGYDPVIGKYRYLVLDYNAESKKNGSVGRQYQCDFLIFPKISSILISLFLTVYTIVPVFLLIMSCFIHNPDNVVPLMACIIASININVWSYFTFRTMINKGVVFLNENGPQIWILICIIIALITATIVFIKYF